MKFYYKNLHNTPSMFKLRLQRYKVFMKKKIKYEFFYMLHIASRNKIRKKEHKFQLFAHKLQCSICKLPNYSIHFAINLQCGIFSTFHNFTFTGSLVIYTT